MTDFRPWAPSAISTTLFGQATTSNPGATAPIQFHGTAANNEYNDHGIYDSPEETAQTSPATVVISVRLDADDDVARIQGVVQNAIYIGSTSKTVRIATKTTGALHNAAAAGTGRIALNAVVLAAGRNGEPHLISLLPTSPATNAELNKETLEANIGVLVSVLHERSANLLHLTLAVEHAVLCTMTNGAFAPYPGEPLTFTFEATP